MTSKLMFAVARMLDYINEQDSVRLSKLEQRFSKSLVKYAENRGFVASTPLRRGDFLVTATRRVRHDR
jgi:hypothetical protein